MLVGLSVILECFWDGGVVDDDGEGVVGLMLSDGRTSEDRCLVQCRGVCRTASTGDIPSVRSAPCGRRFDLHIAHPEPLDRRTGKSLESSPSGWFREDEK